MSKFDDDMARGCLPTGEPLESLYGVGWWTEHDEPEPDPYDLHIAELESRIAELSQAVGLITTLKPTMVMDIEHPLDMAKEVVEYVTVHIAELEEERRWIPVSERLPVGGKVLVLWKDRTIHLDWTFIDGGRYYWWNSGDNVTHWMPLPQPPEVQE